MGEDLIFLEIRLSQQTEYSGSDWGDIIDIANAKGITADQLLKIWKGDERHEPTGNKSGARETPRTGGE